MITFSQFIIEFKATPKLSSGTPNTYKLYDWGDKQVYNEAGSFSTVQLAFMKLNQLYKKDPDAYGDLGVIKYEGNDVFAISERNGKFFKRKL